MKKILKRGLSLFLMLIMVAGILPVTGFAAVDSTGKPTNLENKLVLSIYTTEGKFPGEPATHGSEEYISFNSSFKQTSASGTFKSSAVSELDPSILNPGVLVQGAASGNNKVWGVFSAEGLNQYFLPDATITQDANEAKIIRSIKGISNDVSDADVLKQYEIIWYVIKLQHSSGWFGATEWHIDGLIKEKQYISINYYGNGNTGGAAPDGTTTHTAGEKYTVSGKNTLVKKEGRVDLAFLGWSARADGTGDEVAFYQPGQEIYPTQSLSLYAMWDTTTQYTATVNTYLDNVLTDDKDIHGTERSLSLGTLDGDKYYYYDLTRNSEGVYTTKITGNGKFHLYSKNADGTYTQIGTHQLTIYNQNGSLDVHHYSVQYDANGGEWKTAPGVQTYMYGESVTAISDIPTKDGYRFLGWKDNDGNLIAPEEVVTASIDKTTTLTAQWEQTVTVTVNVTINHEGGNGYDQMESKDEIFLSLVSRANDDSPYLEVVGKTLDLKDSSVTPEQKVTTYTGYTFEDMPGGEVDYTVVTSKSGYDTSINATKDADGNWTIDVVMKYTPTNFDVEFTVEVDEDVPERYIPDAAIVKVTFWSTDRNQWEIITQQEDDAPGVRVDFHGSRVGSGTYPVWKYESNGTTPYGYRIVVTSFVYPDGTIVPVNQVEGENVEWTDDVYTATMNSVPGGKQFGALEGAYIGETDQMGKLNAVITMDLHKVTFDAMGGKVNGQDAQTVEEQYKIPSFKDYVPTRDGGYTFAGWYLDKACTETAVEGTDLTQDITLYAKWIEPLTVSGTVTISGTYLQGGETVSVHDIDRATEAVVVLQEIRNGSVYDVDSKTVTFGDYKDEGKADYSFTGIPNDGKEYQIHVLVLNYGTGYDNESDSNSDFSEKEYTAVFGVDTTADVDAHLTFVPPSYDQKLIVDATPIGEDFRPDSVLSEVMYRDMGDNHPFQRISQHDVTPYGVQIGLTDGAGQGEQSIWKWHTDGTLYDYQMNITKVDNETYNSDTAPFYIVYEEPAYWDADTETPSGDLKATLIPNEYQILFDLNAGEDTVTGMETYNWITEVDEEGVEKKLYVYDKHHKWSYETDLTVAPQREGYIFKGWETEVADVTTDDFTNDDIAAEGNVNIAAQVHQEVVLKAKWRQITYNVTTAADPDEGGVTTGASRYVHGAQATIKATANTGYTFDGWYENGNKVSNDREYSFDVFADHDFVAKFTLDQHTVTLSAFPEAGGTTTGGGTYDYGTNVTITATVNDGYAFLGWYQNYDELVTAEPSFDVEVDKNLEYVAKFKLNEYQVTTAANPTEGGTTTGDGNYKHGETATVTATANTGYTFTGWVDENGNVVSEAASFSFPVTSNRKLTAKFDNILYKVIANAQHGGTAEGTADYTYGQTAKVTAKADATYTFDGWYEGETKVSGDLEYSFTVTSDRTLTAKFTKNGYHIEATPEDAKYGTTSGSGDYDEGSIATVTATAKDGYKFLFWGEGADKVSYMAEYSFTVEGNRELVAYFAPAYTITTIASPEAGGSVSGGGEYGSGEKVTISASANTGYCFVGWYDENGRLVETTTWTVVEDRTLTAKFVQTKTYKSDFVYLFGYNDSVIGAEGPLLRGEVAQMIYRLVRQQGEPRSTGKVFTDTSGQWYQSGMAYMAQVGALDAGQDCGYPEVAVSRGEAYKMICLGLKLTDDTSLRLSQYAAILRSHGYDAPEGTVTGNLLRWEFCQLFNSILGRSNYPLEDAAGNKITAETYNYTDLDSSAYYYEIILRATSTFDENGYVDVEGRMERNEFDFDN